ncbi:MAG TPA: hypothetical protein DGT23_20535 [Micromonosporaceae bacterium]|nr:hypothetical protein [Micromonosporaceae bacterium]
MAKHTTAQKASFTDRRTRALKLASTGHTYDDIARISREEDWEPRPYNSRQAVGADILKGYRARVAEHNEAADVHVQIELEKLDQLEAAAWKVLRARHFVVNQGVIVYMGISADEGTKRGWNSVDALRQDLIKNEDGSFKEPLEDDKPVLDAIDRLLKIADHRAKLTGIYAPVKKQLEVSGGLAVDHEINTLMASLGAGGQGTLATPAAPGERPSVVRHPGSIGKAHRATNGANASA